MRGAAACILLALLLGGCVGKASPATSSTIPVDAATTTAQGVAPASPAAPHPASTSASATVTPSPQPPPNHAPVASLTAGSVPGSLNVTFTLAASDADGDALSYAFDADGPGPLAAVAGTNATFPLRLNATYPTPGLYNASLSVSDGRATTVAHLAVNVTAQAVQSVDFSYVETPTGCDDAPTTMVFGTPAAGILWAEWAVDAATHGRPYTLTFTVGNPAVPLAEIAFYNSAGQRIPGSARASMSPGHGMVPVDATHALVVDCAAAGVKGHYETA